MQDFNVMLKHFAQVDREGCAVGVQLIMNESVAHFKNGT